LSRGDIMNITSSVSPIQVKGIMSKTKFAATTDMDVLYAVRKMIRLGEWYVPVLKSSQDHTYAGTFSLENLISTLLKKELAALSKPLSEVMSTELITCSPEDGVDNVWRLMQERSFAGLPVVKRGIIVGLITQKDLLDSGAILPAFESKKGRFREPPKISSVMRTSVTSLKPTATIREAAELMLNKNIGRVPVVDAEGKLIGIVDREDIAKRLL
jgi:CBS domain-containing protein